MQDADGWGAVITELDTFMDFALAEFRKVKKCSMRLWIVVQHHLWFIVDIIFGDG